MSSKVQTRLQMVSSGIQPFPLAHSSFGSLYLIWSSCLLISIGCADSQDHAAFKAEGGGRRQPALLSHLSLMAGSPKPLSADFPLCLNSQDWIMQSPLTAEGPRKCIPDVQALR